MKQTKKITGIFLLALAMLLSVATTAFAADITITGGANGFEYGAYMLE